MFPPPLGDGGGNIMYGSGLVVRRLRSSAPAIVVVQIVSIDNFLPQLLLFLLAEPSILKSAHHGWITDFVASLPDGGDIIAFQTVLLSPDRTSAV